MNAAEGHTVRQVSGRNKTVPVSGEEQEGGQLVHHELPRQVIKSNVHPVKHKTLCNPISSSLLRQRAETISGITFLKKQVPDLATVKALFPWKSRAKRRRTWLRTVQNPHHPV